MSSKHPPKPKNAPPPQSVRPQKPEKIRKPNPACEEKQPPPWPPDQGKLDMDSDMGA